MSQQLQDAQKPGAEREISRAMVSLYKEYMGRGPTQTKTTITDDLVICVLNDNMTKAEKMLAEEGDNVDFVSEIRRAFQGVLAEKAKQVVAAATGREVISFLSDHDTTNDIAVEMFILRSDETAGWVED